MARGAASDKPEPTVAVNRSHVVWRTIEVEEQHGS
jgi:hypothetical protein